MEGAVPAPVVRERSRRVRVLGNELAAEWAEGFVGSRVRVLFERCGPGSRLSGYSDRYVRVSGEGNPELVGRTTGVLCTARRGVSLLGSLESPSERATAARL
jgi:tRNA A37 methylthiotransferase MiaB